MAKYVAIDNEFNRANYPEEIGKVYDSPPSYVAVMKIEDSSSGMGQAMGTWLRQECHDIGIGTMALSLYVADIRNYLYDGNIKGARRILHDELKPALEHDVEIGQLDSALPIFDRVNSAINQFEQGDGHSQVNAIRDIASLVGDMNTMVLERVVECQCGKPGEVEPTERSALMIKWRENGVDAGKTEGWIDVENTIKDTASRHPEIKDAWDLIWSDIELWEGTDHFTINYGSKMWEDAAWDYDLYHEIKSLFWKGYIDGRRQTGKDIYAIANELVGGGSMLSNPSPEWLSLNKSQRREIIPILEGMPKAREPVMVGEKRMLEPLYDRAKEWADDPREWLLLSLSEKDADLVRDALAKLG